MTYQTELERPFWERASEAFAEWRALPENHDTTRSSFLAGAKWAAIRYATPEAEAAIAGMIEALRWHERFAEGNPSVAGRALQAARDAGLVKP